MDCETGTTIRTLTEHSDTVFAVATLPNTQILASGSYDKTVRLWDYETGATIRTVTEHTASVRAVAFSPDGQLLVSGADDKTVRLLGAGPPIIGHHSAVVSTTALLPGRRHLSLHRG